MNKHTPHIICMIDNSGSMNYISVLVVEAYRAFMEEQRKLSGMAKMSLYLFSDAAEPQYVNQPIHKAPEFTELATAGGTNLFGSAASIMEAHKADENVLFCMFTDGGSVDYDRYAYEQAKAQREANGWEFLYISIGIGAPPSETFGIKKDRALRLDIDRREAAKNWEAAGKPGEITVTDYQNAYDSVMALNRKLRGDGVNPDNDPAYLAELARYHKISTAQGYGASLRLQFMPQFAAQIAEFSKRVIQFRAKVV